MALTANYAEQLNHHPEWSNIYNRIDVTLSTHDAGGLTTNDITMAKKMNTFEKRIKESDICRDYWTRSLD